MAVSRRDARRQRAPRLRDEVRSIGLREPRAFFGVVIIPHAALVGLMTSLKMRRAPKLSPPAISVREHDACALHSCFCNSMTSSVQPKISFC